LLFKNFFKLIDFFLSFLSGHAKIIDQFLSDARVTYHDTDVRDKICFFDETAADPDWMVHQYNLWKAGPSAGWHTYPYFGQHIPINYFKAFCSAAPFYWSDEQYWYEDTRDVPWDVFTMSCKF
jgi:hypothetical protein